MVACRTHSRIRSRGSRVQNGSQGRLIFLDREHRDRTIVGVVYAGGGVFTPALRIYSFACVARLLQLTASLVRRVCLMAEKTGAAVR